MYTKTISLYKNAYGGLSANTWWLSLIMLINRSGTMVVPFMTIYMTDNIGVGIGKAALVTSLFGLGAVIGSLAGGKLTDKIGFYFIQQFTLIGGGLLFILLGQMHKYTSICIVMFFLGMINEAFRPANAVAVAHFSNEKNRARSYSLNRLAINLGWALGGSIGGFLAQRNISLIFWVDGFTNIAAALVLYFLLAPSKNKEVKTVEQDVGKDNTSVYKDTTYLLFIGMVFFFAFCFFQFFVTLPPFYNSEWKLSKDFIGLLMGANGLVIVIFEMIIIFSLERKRSNLFYITRGIFLIGISFLILNLVNVDYKLLALLFMLLITFGEIISMPFMNSYWIERTTSQNRGQYAALYTVAWSSAQIVGPVVCGQIAEHWGYNMLWWLLGSICIMLCLGFQWLKRRA